MAPMPFASASATPTSSTYTDDVIAYHGVSDEALNLIQKPFRLDALSARIREVLDQTSSPL
jgi:DNA-binding response OmpR family regulator